MYARAPEGLIRGRLTHPQTIIGGGRRQLPTGRDQQRTKRRFARDVTQDAQRHPWFSSRFHHAANSMDCPFHDFGDFRDGGFWFWNGIQAFVGKRGQRDVMTHDRYWHINVISLAPWPTRHP
jgi:hypothetical protein